ncbi:MAG: hypothetical protein AB7J28_05710 [Hyphomonadaceae bacterium]
MASLRRYAFDTEFAPDGTILRDGATGEKKRLTPEELEAERQTAYKSGQRDAVAVAERANADAAAALADHAKAILARLDEDARRLRGEAAMIAMSAARKIAGEALDAFGQERAAAAIEAAMEALPHGPRLIIRVTPAHVDTLKKRIEVLVADHAYAGAILVRADETAKTGDIAIDWTEGVVTFNRDDIAGRVEELIAAALAAPAEGSAP